jgi:hypothetical protein
MFVTATFISTILFSHSSIRAPSSICLLSDFVVPEPAWNVFWLLLQYLLLTSCHRWSSWITSGSNDLFIWWIQDGNVICASIPIYGNGNEAGNEDGYIVGMSTCYPEPGSVKITAGENLTLESNYDSTNKHTGVMGFFYIYIAEQAPNVTFSHAPVQVSYCSIFS